MMMMMMMMMMMVIMMIKNCDIIILSEIWGHEIEDIPNFDIITLSPPQKSPTAKSGRFSGGILIARSP